MGVCSVSTVVKSIDDYRAIVGDEQVDEICRLAEPFRGARVLHINGTAFGGGVAELLATLVPLMQNLGLNAEWQVMRGTDEFFTVTKAMHNSLQGATIQWTPEKYEIWLQYNQMNADLFDQDFDFVIVHDPQPAGILQFLSQRNGGQCRGKWIWRCHLDLTEAQPEVWAFLHRYVEIYHAAIFTLEDFVPEDLNGPEIFIVPPAIDPLSPKNIDLLPGTVSEILARYRIDTQRPILSQISRFDQWKDPLGVIDGYRLVKKEMPEVQLIMVASMAHDDPEGWACFERTLRRAGEDFDIHFLTNLNGVGNIEVNAFQRASTVVVQKSLREGFGLTVAEALWKGKPVVAGGVGGIPLQIQYGRNGYLVITLAEFANRVLHLLHHPKTAERMGKAGKEYIRQNFLITRHLRDYLKIFNQLSDSACGGK